MTSRAAAVARALGLSVPVDEPCNCDVTTATGPPPPHAGGSVPRMTEADHAVAALYAIGAADEGIPRARHSSQDTVVGDVEVGDMHATLAYAAGQADAGAVDSAPGDEACVCADTGTTAADQNRSVTGEGAEHRSTR